MGTDKGDVEQKSYWNMAHLAPSCFRSATTSMHPEKSRELPLHHEKKKLSNPGLWNALLLPTESSQFKISYKSSMSQPPDNSDATGRHNHWTNPLLLVSPARASAGPSEDRDRPGDANKGWSYPK